MAFKIRDVDVVSFDHFRDVFGYNEDDSMAWFTYEAMRSAEYRKRGDPPGSSFAVAVVRDLEDGAICAQPHYCDTVRGLSKEEREIAYGVYDDGPTAWKVRLRLKAKISNVKIKQGMVPKMTEREFSRWEEGNGLPCQRLPDPTPDMA
ncbi:hypothetical protein RQP46_001461 [Phenoliferia psychrophenolica]